jgi:epoxyqueuosine reductase
MAPSSPEPSAAAERIRDAALALGFVRVGFTPVERFSGAAARLERWLADGHQAEMTYLCGGDRADPSALLAQARTLIAVALPYAAPATSSEPAPPLTGFVARYARGADYHDVIKAKLRVLAAACADIIGRPVLARPCVDTAPLLERDAAARAGLGFAAKSTMLIVPGAGSYVLLGELLVDIDVAPSSETTPRCGACRACLDACPTGAFVDAHVLDARRCISYLTIELQGPIPRELRPLIGRRVFGCDVCQEVCPFNAASARKPGAAELAPLPELDPVDLVALLELTASGYRRLVKGSALRRASLARLARNAAVALGNTGDPAAVAPLSRATLEHKSALVRGHAAWALGRIGGDLAEQTLRRATTDADAFVRDEAELALAGSAAIDRATGTP